jgi:hypothetical protein
MPRDAKVADEMDQLLRPIRKRNGFTIVCELREKMEQLVRDLNYVSLLTLPSGINLEEMFYKNYAFTQTKTFKDILVNLIHFEANVQVSPRHTEVRFNNDVLPNYSSVTRKVNEQQKSSSFEPSSPSYAPSLVRHVEEVTSSNSDTDHLLNLHMTRREQLMCVVIIEHHKSQTYICIE